jgi:hypothetical protein
MLTYVLGAVRNTCAEPECVALMQHRGVKKIQIAGRR